jgi:ABC-type transport system involved in multi-copper enzyme maturation permease subunit
MTTTAPHTTTLPRTDAAGGPAGIPLNRLIRVELRKLVDTRAGLWLLVGIGLATVAAVAVYLFTADASELTFAHLVNVTVLPQSWLLPVLGIMAVTSEWTQRTGLVTHALVPRRNRVLAAKFAATGLLGGLAVVLALAVAAGANLLASGLMDGNGDWAYGIAGLRDTVLFQALSLLAGLALGALLMNTAAAVALYFLLPTAFGLVFSMVDSLTGVAGWIDLTTSQGPLFDHSIAGVEWLELLATTTWWILLPLAAGLWRLLHREIK